MRLLLLVDLEAVLDPRQGGKEEGRLLRLPWGLLGLVALLDDLEIEERLPAGARKECEGDEFTVELGWSGEDVCRFVLDSERREGVEDYGRERACQM